MSSSPGWIGSTASTGAPSMARRAETSRASSGRRRKASSQEREMFMSRESGVGSLEPDIPDSTLLTPS